MAQSVKHISSLVLDAWFTTLSVFMFAIGLLFTASLFIYGAKPSRKNRSLAKELTTGAVASVFSLWSKTFEEKSKSGKGAHNWSSCICLFGFWVLVFASCLWCLCLISPILTV